MACNSNLTQGFTRDCRNSVGGIKAVYVGKTEDLTYSASNGSITDITPTGSFYKYELRKNTSDFTETITADDANGTVFYEQEANVMLSKMEAEKRNELQLVAQNLITMIVEDRNGKHWMLGKENGLTLGGSALTGTAMGDRNGYELTFTGQEPEPTHHVSGSVVDTVT